MTDNDFILLMEEYFDGSLEAEGRAALRRELQADPARRALFETQSRQHIRIHAQTTPLDFSESQRIALTVMDAVAAERHPATFADILKEQTLRERIAAIREGLKAPRYSGKHRYARFALLRVFGPPLLTAALCILIIAALALAVPRFFPVEEDPEGINIQLRPSERPTPPDPRPDPVPTQGQPVPPVVTSMPIPVGRPVPITALPTHLIGRTPAARAEILKKSNNTRTEKTVTSALQWLKEHQQADGSWEGQDPIAMTGLALLAFLGHGDLPDDTAYGPTVRRGLQHLIARQDNAGHFSGNVYAHAIATYAMAEAFTLSRIFPLREPMERGIAVVVGGQQPGGGFDYQYSKGSRFDTSVTGWQVQALKAARLAGSSHPGLDPALEKCLRFLRTAAFAGDGSGFVYSGQNGAAPPASGATWTMTGVGTLCLQLLGARDCRQARHGLALLEDVAFPWTRDGKPRIYGAYYVTQARFQGGSPASWEPWNRQMQNALLAAQHKDGHWEGGDYDQGSHVYTTTLCTLMLEVYYRYLPTYAKAATNDVVTAIATGVQVDVQ